jgi:hypothetical protein
MANIVSNFEESKTIRDFLSAYLKNKDDKILSINTAGLGKDPKFQKVYNIDLIWDGGSYYLAYTESEAVDAPIKIDHLDMVLPAKIENRV